MALLQRDGGVRRPWLRCRRRPVPARRNCSTSPSGTRGWKQALRDLPPHQRVPLVLFHFEQQGCDDIARLLGVSVGKVRTDMHRGRLALRRWLS